MAYATVNIEGGLLPADLLDRIATEHEQGQSAKDFELSGKLTDVLQSAFSDARSFWHTFQRRLQYSKESPTTLTREAWMRPFMEILGFELVFQPRAVEIGGRTYAISHRAGQDPLDPPVHIVAIGQELDTKAEGSKRSPHAMVQEYLNRSEALWGIVTDGSTLRLLRNSTRISRPAYIEFDLRGMVVDNLYNEFTLLYRLTHRTRFPRGLEDAHECWLERYYQQGLDEGGRVLDHMRDGEEAALLELGNAFLAHPSSESLRDSLRKGLLDEMSYYNQLLQLMNRLLFLFVVEERKLLLTSEGDKRRQSIYNRYYSVDRLRERAEQPFANDTSSDLWRGLVSTFELFRYTDWAEQLGLSALDSDLFASLACRDLEGAGCENAKLLRALYRFTHFVDKGILRRVNFAAIGGEEFGSAYESMLDYHPYIEVDPVPKFDLVAGTERKRTGSYFTPQDLVRELVESALVPVLEQRLAGAKTQEEKEAALLSMRVCDPAAGSGQFLSEAAQQMAHRLAQIRTGEEEPAPAAFRVAMHDVIRSCIYAVDKNPAVVDRCKARLRTEGFNAGFPLSFLDNHIKCGDALVGVTDLKVLEDGIPDDAYKPVSGDDRAVATAIRKRNAKERDGQMGLQSAMAPECETVQFARDFGDLGGMEERTVDDVHFKQEMYASLRARGGRWDTYKEACNLWTSAFFLPLRKAEQAGLEDELVPTTGTVRRHLSRPGATYGPLMGQVEALAQEQAFFHWPLEFPEVFLGSDPSRRGFDVMLGNPPWERIKLQETEFFAARNPEIARASNKAAREKLIKTLPERDPELAAQFVKAVHAAESQSKFLRGSGRFKLTGRGDVNTYAVFAETFLDLHNPTGRAGCIVPSGIATDDTTKLFFQYLMDERRLASLYDFENRNAIFNNVHRSYKFCLLTLTGNEGASEKGAEFAFFLHSTEQLREAERRFTLSSEDIALLNPNTRTCPIFRTERDADIMKAIYRRVPVLLDEVKGEAGNPWNARLRSMVHMSNDSHLFYTHEDLRADGRLNGNVYDLPSMRYLPLYEAKMFHQFDHRWSTYRGSESRDSTQIDKEDPVAVPVPRYWMSEGEVTARLDTTWDRHWQIGYRDIARATDERTAILAVTPRSAAANHLLLPLAVTKNTRLAAALVGSFNSFVFDYSVRPKVGGTHLNFFLVKQLAVIPPEMYDSRTLDWIVPRIMELTYTAWDLQPFAKDLGYDGPPFRWEPERRFLLRCELDAAYFHLYGIARDDVDYIMETFPIVRRKDEGRWGEYRTKRVILEMYDEIARAVQTGVPYQTRLDPPPADPRAAHSEQSSSQRP